MLKIELFVLSLFDLLTLEIVIKICLDKDFLCSKPEVVGNPVHIDLTSHKVALDVSAVT